MTNTSEFTTDWFSSNAVSWHQHLTHLAGRPGVSVLELGVWEGRATRWLLENVLTGTDSGITVVDTFAGSIEHQDVDHALLLQRFKHNVAPWEDRVYTYDANTCWALAMMLVHPHWHACAMPPFDFIYIDADHRSPAVLADACMAWPLLKVGGLLCFDDLGWRHALPSGEIVGPREGIEAFLSAFAHEVAEVEMGDQVWLRKAR